MPSQGDNREGVGGSWLPVAGGKSLILAKPGQVWRQPLWSSTHTSSLWGLLAKDLHREFMKGRKGSL